METSGGVIVCIPMRLFGELSDDSYDTYILE